MEIQVTSNPLSHHSTVSEKLTPQSKVSGLHRVSPHQEKEGTQVDLLLCMKGANFCVRVFRYNDDAWYRSFSQILIISLQS